MRTWLRRTIAVCTPALGVRAPELVANLTPSVIVSSYDRVPCQPAQSHGRRAGGDYCGSDVETRAFTRIYDSVNVIRARMSDLIATLKG